MNQKYSEGESTRYAATLLRVVLALKREPEANAEELITQIIRDAGVEGAAFRQFLGSTEVMDRLRRGAPTTRQAERGKQRLKDRAAELGIVLEERPASATVRAAGKKVRSPVA